jgi:hypothetical protein
MRERETDAGPAGEVRPGSSVDRQVVERKRENTQRKKKGKRTLVACPSLGQASGLL